jgi:hypothetical protein
MLTHKMITVSPSSPNLIDHCFTNYYNGSHFGLELIRIGFKVIASITVDKYFIGFSCFGEETIFVVIGVGK